MKKQKLVKALLYRAQICDSMLEQTHGMYYFLSEIFVPKEKICMNEKGFVFISKKPRSNDTVEIKISQKLIADAKKLMMIEPNPCNIELTKGIFWGTLNVVTDRGCDSVHNYSDDFLVIQ